MVMMVARGARKTIGGIMPADFRTIPLGAAMPIPDYQTAMLPLLRLAGDGAEHRFRDAVEQLATEFQLTDAERSELLPSGTAPLFDNRIGWARTYLKQAGLLQSLRRGVFRITEEGKALLARNPPHVDVELLQHYAAFREFRIRRRDGTETGVTAHPEEQLPESIGDQTPEDQLASAYQKLRTNLESELLERIKASSPAFFERLVIDLLVAMGYGGSRQDAGRAIGRSGDGGIDGIIKEDKLGLDVIYVQAKRWEGNIGRPEIQKFAGALQGQRANKGVFITTSSYSREAEEYAGVINTKIILIDGERLTSLMVDYNVAVTPVGLYELKRIDSDYFEGE
jgi:restriction system protein